jgi:hypothetical protein
MFGGPLKILVCQCTGHCENDFAIGICTWFTFGTSLKTGLAGVLISLKLTSPAVSLPTIVAWHFHPTGCRARLHDAFGDVASG